MFNHSMCLHQIYNRGLYVSIISILATKIATRLCGTVVQLNLAADLWSQKKTPLFCEQETHFGHLVTSLLVAHLHAQSCPVVLIGNPTNQIINACTNKCCCKARKTKKKKSSICLAFFSSFSTLINLKFRLCFHDILWKHFFTGSTYRCFLADSFYQLLFELKDR